MRYLTDVDNADLSAAGEVGVLEPRLAAVFSSGAGGGEKMNSGVLTRRRHQTSPHTLMGAGVITVSLLTLLSWLQASAAWC